MDVLKIATYHSDQWFQECAVTNLEHRQACPSPGPKAEAFYSWLRWMNIPYKLIPYNRDNFGVFHNGSWHGGMFGHLQNGEIDVISQFWADTLERRQMFQFSYPATQKLSIGILVKAEQPALLTETWLLLKTFTVWTWSCLLSTFVILALGIMTLHKDRTKWSKVNRPSSRVLFAVLGLSALLFLNLYQGTLLTQLLNEETTLIFDDPWMVPGLIKTKQLTLVIEDDADFRHQSILFSSHEFFEELRQAVAVNPMKVENNFSKILGLVATGKYVYLITDDYMNLAKLNHCGVVGIEAPGLPTYQTSVMLLINSKWTPNFTDAMITMRQHVENIMDRYQEYWKRLALEKCKKQSIHGRQPLNVMCLSGAFLCLAVMNGVSTVTLLFEILRARQMI